ncbi:hypothetical protein SHAM105786_16800 [Shewanella amazonensis]|uniref:Uncharacterized protein n=1 Tax=Shewanella amazonensis (strain ATCC BAA-1098 / SB2B) TaxID=326297 RepID=A1SAN0_SHEAM|nr:hypothetical protein [Shewanella amazonensis]ABM01437.1 hypothetical protein Sama_3234 [Shewanella amazonensis SB2B]
MLKAAEPILPAFTRRPRLRLVSVVAQAVTAELNLGQLATVLLVMSLGGCGYRFAPNDNHYPEISDRIVSAKVSFVGSLYTPTLPNRWQLMLSMEFPVTGGVTSEVPSDRRFYLIQEYSPSLAGKMGDNTAPDAYPASPFDYQEKKSRSGQWRFSPERCELKLYTRAGNWMATLSGDLAPYTSLHPQWGKTTRHMLRWRLTDTDREDLQGLAFYHAERALLCDQTKAWLEANEPENQALKWRRVDLTLPPPAPLPAGRQSLQD